MKWGIFFSVLLGFAMIGNLDLFAYALYALLAVVLASRFLSQYWIQHVRSLRLCSTTEATIGDKVTVIVEVHNTGRVVIPWLLAEELLPNQALYHDRPPLARSGDVVKVCLLWPGKKQTLVYQLKCNRRGYFPLGPLVLETGDLFGLHRRYRISSPPQYLLVMPKPVHIDGYDIASRRPIGEVRMTHRLFEDPTRISGVRNYEPRDPLNRVHWGATARTGTLHSKVYEPSTIAGATVLLDFHVQSYPSRDEPVRSELAITAAASIGNALYELGQPFGLLTNARDAVDRIRKQQQQEAFRDRRSAHLSGGRPSKNDRLRPVHLKGNRGVGHREGFLKTLGRLELSDGLTLSQLLIEATCHLARDASVVAILGQLTPEMVISLAELRVRGFAVTVLLNVHTASDFQDASAYLMAEGIASYHLADQAAIETICRVAMLR